MNANTKKVLLLGALAVGVYFVYRWYEGRQSNSGGTSLGSSTGTSGASTLTSLSAGPETNVNYYGGSSTTQAVVKPVTISRRPGW